MPDKPTATHSLGLELSPPRLFGIQLSQHKGKPKIEKVFDIALDQAPSQGDNVNPLYMTEQGKELKEALAKDLVVTVLHTNEVLVRPLEMKITKDKDIDQVLAFQAEPILPFPVENGVVDRIKISQSKEGVQLTLLAARKDYLQQHLEEWKSLHIEPEVVSCEPMALAAYCKAFSPSENFQFVLHLGHLHTTCVLVKEGKLIAAQSLPQGVDNLRLALAADKRREGGNGLDPDLNHIDWLSVDAQRNPALAGALDNLRLETTRTLYALSKQAKGKETPEIVLTGEGAGLNNLPAALCQNLSKTLAVPQLPPHSELNAKQLQKYAIPIGAAMTALPNADNQINFRQDEFAYPDPWKRYKMPLAIYAGLCIFLAFSLFLFGKAYLANQEDGIRRHYAELLAVMNKPFSGSEAEFRKKFPAEGQPDGAAITLKNLSMDDLEIRLSLLEKELRSTPDTFPLLPNVPRVSDVLAWLSTDPHMAAMGPVTKVLKPLLQIESFTYTIVKRPELSKKQEKYQVKVELELSSPTPKLAREFHDALIAPNDFVDPKGEVKWSSNRGKYKTSFYLKDKTVYPSTIK